MALHYQSQPLVHGHGHELRFKNMRDCGNPARGKVGLLLAVVQTEEIQQRVEHLPHTLGRLPDIIHIHGAFIRATTFLHQSGIASFCQSYFFVVEVVYDDRFAFFRASVWQIVYTIREALLLGVI